MQISACRSCQNQQKTVGIIGISTAFHTVDEVCCFSLFSDLSERENRMPATPDGVSSPSDAPRPRLAPPPPSPCDRREDVGTSRRIRENRPMGVGGAQIRRNPPTQSTGSMTVWSRRAGRRHPRPAGRAAISRGWPGCRGRRRSGESTFHHRKNLSVFR